MNKRTAQPGRSIAASAVVGARGGGSAPRSIDANGPSSRGPGNSLDGTGQRTVSTAVRTSDASAEAIVGGIGEAASLGSDAAAGRPASGQAVATNVIDHRRRLRIVFPP